MEATVDESTLIATCEQRGVVVTREQLKRWRVAGVLPRPRQEHALGVRGSKSWYPREAVEQALIICELLQMRRRSLDDVCIELWRRGMLVDRDALRRTLARPLQQMADEWTVLLGEAGGDGTEAADQAMRRFGFRDASSMTKLMLQRLGGPRSGAASMRDVVWFFFLRGFRGDEEGVDSGPGSHLETAVAAATGVARSQEDGILDHDPWLPPGISATDVVTQLGDSGAFDIPRMAVRIREASDADLDRARDDVLLFTGLATITAWVQAMYGADVAGLASVDAMASDAVTGLPLLINTMLVLRDVLGDDPFNRIGEVVAHNLRRYEAIMAIEAAMPGSAALIAGGEKVIAELPDEKRQALQRGLADLFSRRPDLAAEFE